MIQTLAEIAETGTETVLFLTASRYICAIVRLIDANEQLGIDGAVDVGVVNTAALFSDNRVLVGQALAWEALAERNSPVGHVTGNMEYAMKMHDLAVQGAQALLYDKTIA